MDSRGNDLQMVSGSTPWPLQPRHFGAQDLSGQEAPKPRRGRSPEEALNTSSWAVLASRNDVFACFCHAKDGFSAAISGFEPTLCWFLAATCGMSCRIFGCELRYLGMHLPFGVGRATKRVGNFPLRCRSEKNPLHIEHGRTKQRWCPRLTVQNQRHT